MASSSRNPTPTKRLLHELQTYQSDPNEALLELGPVNDDELMHWRAVMKGVPGTAYEGIPSGSDPIPLPIPS
jgi:peroxin-4